MKVTRHEPREQQIFAKMRSSPPLEGQHVTEAIYCNVKTWGRKRLAAAGHELPDFDEATLLRFLMGHGMAQVLEEGEMRQIQAIAPDTEDVGTIDVWLRDHPVEIKVTSASVRRDIGSMDHWIQQLGEYVWRSTSRDKKTPWGELWIVYLLGDHGQKICTEHGTPKVAPNTPVTKRPRARHPETESLRLICPDCSEFLAAGTRETMLRCFRLDWTWEELNSLHAIHAQRQRELQDDLGNAEYGIGNPPLIRHGYDFECPSCPVKDAIGCPGRGVPDDLEAQLKGSILEMQKEKATA
jgi:hypothetical protein